MTSRTKLFIVTFLTFVRFPLVLLFFAGALINVKYQLVWLFVTSLAFLMLSAVTDFFDGYLARKFNVVTKFGEHADPLMDKFFYLSTLPLLVFIATKNNHIPHAVFLLILTVSFLARDQWVTFLRSIGSLYNASGGANWSGKLRTAINLPMICLIYFEESAPPKAHIISHWVLNFMEAVAFVSNFLSLYVYTSRYWPYLRKSTDR